MVGVGCVLLLTDRMVHLQSPRLRLSFYVRGKACEGFDLRPSIFDLGTSIPEVRSSKLGARPWSFCTRSSISPLEWRQEQKSGRDGGGRGVMGPRWRKEFPFAG